MTWCFDLTTIPRGRTETKTSTVEGKWPPERARLLAEVADAVDYDPRTGKFTWAISPISRIPVGSPAGFLHRGKGYVFIKFRQVNFLASDIAFFKIHGRPSKQAVDHINGDRSDDRSVNLREASHAENRQNSPVTARNKSGYPGVSFTTRGNWKAEIAANGKRKFLGRFPTKEEAYEAYLEAKKTWHPFAPNGRGYPPAPSGKRYDVSAEFMPVIEDVGSA